MGRNTFIKVAMVALAMMSAAVSAQARGPHRHSAYMRCGGRYYAAAVAPPIRTTVQVERRTTVNKTTRPERKLMAVAYIQKNGGLSVNEYCGFTGLDKRSAEAELDSFTLDRRTPLVRKILKKKVVYSLVNE